MKIFEGKLTADYASCSLYFNNKSNEKYDIFSNDWSHYKLFNSMIRFMRSRGWKIGLDTEVTKTIRSNYYYGCKNRLELKAEKYPAGFRFEFYQNVTKSENRNGGYYDFNKYEKFPYLLKLTIQNELLKVIDKFGDMVSVSEYKKPIKKAEEKLCSEHAHWRKFDPKTFNEWGDAVRDYDKGSNSKDGNGKYIESGEIKYFYSGRMLLRGRVYHNINNMWWVVLNDTEYTNIASFNLFDRDDSLPFKKPYTVSQTINRLNKELQKEMHNQNFERCVVLRDLIKSMSYEKKYNVWSIKHDCWWCANNAGYTSVKEKAGIYLESDIDQSYHNDGVDSEIVEI